VSIVGTGEFNRTPVTVAYALSISRNSGLLSLWGVYHLFRLPHGPMGRGGYGVYIQNLAARGRRLGWQMRACPHHLVTAARASVGPVVGIAMLSFGTSRIDAHRVWAPFGRPQAAIVLLMFGNLDR